MHFRNLHFPCQIRNGACNFQNAVMRPGRQAQCIKRPCHQRLRICGQRTMLAHHSGRQLRIAVNAGTGISLTLELPRGIDPPSDLFAAFRRAAFPQLFISYAMHRDMQVNPIHHWARDLFPIGADTLIRTIAPSGRMSEVTAFAGVHCRYQHKATGIGISSGNTRNRHHTILQRLAQHFNSIAFELRKLVEKQYAVMGKRDFSRLRASTAAAGHSGGRYRMVRTPKRACKQHGFPLFQQSRHRVNFAALQRFLQCHIG